MEEQHVLQDKKEKLRSILLHMDRVAVAFSAGVDSAFLLKTAQDVLGDRVLAITGRTISVPSREIQESVTFCQTYGIRQIIADVDQMSVDGFSENTADRCYFCKKALFKSFSDIAAKSGFPVLIEGTNANDTQDFRPGMRALRELQIRSPLLEVGLTKEEIRVLSREMGLPTWDKPSFACLATRIPYGDTITPQKLAVIDTAEQFLKENGFCQFRVRMHDKIARIEIEPAQFTKITEPRLRQEICRKFTELGFLYVTLDLNGYASGSMNKSVSDD